VVNYEKSQRSGVTVCASRRMYSYPARPATFSVADCAVHYPCHLPYEIDRTITLVAGNDLPKAKIA
jgi:hypothetical protein